MAPKVIRTVAPAGPRLFGAEEGRAVMQGWWPNLLQGAVSAVIGGVVAALTAWGVVIATRRHERRLDIEREARTAALNLLFELGGIWMKLTRAAKGGATLPPITDGREWGLSVFAAEVAMFSLDQKAGSRFSQAIGDLRRALEIIEGVDNPDRASVERAVRAYDAVVDFLADSLMRGRHRQPGPRLPASGTSSSDATSEPPSSSVSAPGA